MAPPSPPPHPPPTNPGENIHILILILTFLVGLVFGVKLGNLFSETLNCANISDDKVGLRKKENSKPRFPEFAQGRDDATIFQLIFPSLSDSRSECLAFQASSVFASTTINSFVLGANVTTMKNNIKFSNGYKCWNLNFLVRTLIKCSDNVCQNSSASPFVV